MYQYLFLSVNSIDGVQDHYMIMNIIIRHANLLDNELFRLVIADVVFYDNFIKPCPS